jgi:hypothetical protein
MLTFLDIATIIRRTDESPLGAINCANSPGTGKTFCAMGVVKFSADLDQQNHKSANKTKFLPSLFIVPPNIIYQYAQEFSAMFPGLLTIHIWYSTSANLPPDMRPHKDLFLAHSVESFIAAYNSLDKTDPGTARHIFLTSYSTLQARARVNSNVQADLDEIDTETGESIVIPPSSSASSAKPRGGPSDAVCVAEFTTME